jgi:hypothetical protein
VKWYETEFPKAGYIVDDMSDLFAYGPSMPPAVFFHKDVAQGIFSGDVSGKGDQGSTTITIEAKVVTTQ